MMKKIIYIIGIVNLVFLHLLHAQTNGCPGTVLTPGTGCTWTAGSTAGFTNTSPAISCNGFTGNADDDGWYSFVATGNEHTINVQSNANFDAVIDVRQGGCPGTTILCADATVGGGLEFISWNGFVAGQTYYIRLYDYAAGSGGFNICITRPSCTNGIKDGSETDVDCGGSCPACAGYMMPTNGIAGEYVGACLVNTCSGNFYDEGGPAGNYTNNLTGIPLGDYRVFCPNAVGKCMRVTFTSFNINDVSAFCFNSYGTATNCCDELWITNSSSQNGPLLWGGCGTTLPPVITSTDASGCLSFRFHKDNTVTTTGWAATLSCVPCATGPNGTDNNDCNTSTQICNTTPFATNSTGPGLVSEACGGSACFAGGENHTNWFVFQIATSGVLNLAITPSVGTDDYDFSMFGPGKTCGNLGNPIRCSDSYLGGATGLGGGAVEVSENVLGDKWVAPLNVIAGEIYYISIDEWSITGAGYTLDFLGSTATISCIPLPVELLSFTAAYSQEKRSVDVKWSTASEKNNDYFVVERSIDGQHFEKIASVNGTGNTTQVNNYQITDSHPYYKEINYYRLKQVDFDGNFKYSAVVAVIIEDPKAYFSISPNPITRESKLYFNSTVSGIWNAAIYNGQGKVVFNQQVQAAQGPNEMNIPFINLPQGVYQVKMNDSHQSYQGKFVIY